MFPLNIHMMNPGLILDLNLTLPHIYVKQFSVLFVKFSMCPLCLKAASGYFIEGCRVNILLHIYSTNDILQPEVRKTIVPLGEYYSMMANTSQSPAYFDVNNSLFSAFHICNKTPCVSYHSSV